MKRTTMFLTEELDSELHVLAGRRGMPVSGLVREALVEYVAREKRDAPRLPGYVAVGRSGQSDIAERHEDLLWKEPHGEPDGKLSSHPRPALPQRKRKRG